MFNTKMQYNVLSYKSALRNIRVWLQVMLSYLFIAAIIATLTCAYLTEINATVITVCLILGALIGGYQAEAIRKKVGLHQYALQLHQQRDLH